MIDPRNRGLVLVELLIVLVVLGVLAGIAIPRLTNAKEHAYDAAAMSNLRSAMRAVQEYESNHLQYPATMAEAGFEPSQGIEFTRWDLGSSNGTPYLLMEAGHGDSDWLFYSFYPVQGETRKRDRAGDAPEIDVLNTGENVAK